MPDVTQTVADFRDYIRRIAHYQEALALMYWDLRTGAPRKGVELRSEAIGTLSAEVFRMSTSPELEEFLNRLGEPEVFEGLDAITRTTVQEVRKEFERSRKIPPDRHKQFVVLTSQAESVWSEAKHESNFALFRPYLEQIVDMTVEFIDYWGYGENKYDTLLDKYEPGMTVRKLDEIFGGLRVETVRLVQAIVASGVRPDTTPFRQHFSKEQQRELSLFILGKLGYDFAAGRLDETVHPFQTSINRYDVRVTTKFLEDDLRSSLFGTIHECGHAMYEQGISPDLVGTPLCTGASMGIHESQSRFYENMLGRSREFWEALYGDVVRMFPGQFGNVSLDQFYRGINDVEPSLIRIEADEVTYNLHIMIRYELEKGLVNQTIRVADLPELWREKMKEYLGVVPDNDAEGVLQDVHWSGGDFGYFPSYSLGNIYAAQLRHALGKAVPDYREQVRRGNLSAVNEWLAENVHKHGKMLMPAEIIRRATGEEINSRYLVDYLHEKFDPLYNL